MDYWRIFLLALIGGWLGVFFMIPSATPVDREGARHLLYPEGTACADVLIAGDKGRIVRQPRLLGLGLGALYTFFQNENLFRGLAEHACLQSRKIILADRSAPTPRPNILASATSSDHASPACSSQGEPLPGW